MGKMIKSLGEAELEIMQVIWRAENPVTSAFVLKELQDKRNWKLPTLMTSLSRLVEKGFISCDRTTGNNLYSPIILENDYKTKESKNFLERMYDNSIQNMIATLYGSKELKDSDVAELRRFLDGLEKKELTDNT